MEAQQLEIKLFAADATPIDPEVVTRIFHGWIQEGRIPEDILVDVTDYSHVHEGPGVVLIAHGAHYALDEGRGRYGLLYTRKRALKGPGFGSHLRECFAAALHAAALLESDPALAGKLRFRTDEVLFRIQNRLLAPNTRATFDAVAPELQAFLDGLLGPGAASIAHVEDDPREAFTVRIAAEGAPSVSALHGKLT